MVVYQSGRWFGCCLSTINADGAWENGAWRRSIRLRLLVSTYGAPRMWYVQMSERNQENYPRALVGVTALLLAA